MPKALADRLTDELGLREHVRLVGTQAPTQVREWLVATDLSRLATRNEGRANVILEALAGGLPVVTTDVGGSREVVRDGTNGILVPLGDRRRLTDAIEDGLTRGRDHRAIATDAGAWIWDRIAEDVVGELRCLMARDRPEDRLSGAAATSGPETHR